MPLDARPVPRLPGYAGGLDADGMVLARAEERHGALGLAAVLRRCSVTARQPSLPGLRPSGSHAGALRQATGGHAEKIADGMHHQCELAGVAWVRRVSSHLRPVRGRDGGLRVIASGPGTVDCLGMLEGGRAVAVEIKSCTDGRLRFSQIPQHQRDELAQVMRFGGLALVLVVAGLKAYAVEWWVVSKYLKAGEKSMGPDDLAPHEVPVVGAYLKRWTEERR